MTSLYQEPHIHLLDWIYKPILRWMALSSFIVGEIQVQGSYRNCPRLQTWETRAQIWTQACLLSLSIILSCYFSTGIQQKRPNSILLFDSPFLGNATPRCSFPVFFNLSFRHRKLSTTSVLHRKTHSMLWNFCYKTFNVNLQYNVNFYEKNLKYTRFLQ